jgi:hypothetical protein
VILALSVLVLAGEPMAPAETYDRLFGPEPEAPMAAAPATEWPRIAALGLLGAGALGAVWLKKRRPSRGVDPALRIIGRQALGDRATLVLVDVEEPDGGRRRILIGTGGGAPVLISDLGFSVPDLIDSSVEPLERVDGRQELPC